MAFGTVFFFGTCWWLTFAPITYAGFPTLLAYFLLLCVAAFVGLYPALFSSVFSLFLKRFGYMGILSAPFLWTAIEFLRLWTTGNNWNALGYSQAFNLDTSYINLISIGGVFLVGFDLLVYNSLIFAIYLVFLPNLQKFDLKPYFQPFNLELLNIKIENGWRLQYLIPIYSLIAYFFPIVGFALFLVDSKVRKLMGRKYLWKKFRIAICLPIIFYGLLSTFLFFSRIYTPFHRGTMFGRNTGNAFVIAVQPNVPMSGLNSTKWQSLRKRQTELAEKELRQPNLLPYIKDSMKYLEPSYIKEMMGDDFDIDKWKKERVFKDFEDFPKIVILPESPMNFQYERDEEFRNFINNFAIRNNVSVLFNSAEPDKRRKFGFFNSAVMINEKGEKVDQYDKIHLLPFGEFVPLPEPIEWIIPPMVGRFSPGEEYDLLPFGDTKGGIMICFESHFPSLAREFARKGADVLIEMTNDGYLGNTPVLRQHLASAVFRAVETNRPVVRVTNVGVTAYINERGEVLDVADVYTEATRTWSVSKSDGKQTIYVKYGEWFALLCSFISLGLLSLCFFRKK